MLINLQKIKILKKIIISTDDPQIMKIGINYNVLVPWLRPKRISSSKSKSISLVFHALQWFKKKSIKINTVILLQPTSPFRSLRTINKMLNIYKQNKKSVVTVTTDLKKNKKILFMNKNKILMENKFNNKKIIPVNIAGNIYINSIQNLKNIKILE